MTAHSIYSAKGYRSFLNDWIQSQGKKHGLLSRICQIMECQNAHLTRVLRESVHLTMDQGFRICEFLGLSQAEADYFMKLLEYDRAADQEYKRHLKFQMDLLKLQQEDLSKRVKERRITDAEIECFYYLKFPRFSGHILPDRDVQKCWGNIWASQRNTDTLQSLSNRQLS